MIITIAGSNIEGKVRKSDINPTNWSEAKALFVQDNEGLFDNMNATATLDGRSVTLNDETSLIGQESIRVHLSPSKTKSGC